jgi:hypothetical protein
MASIQASIPQERSKRLLIEKKGKIADDLSEHKSWYVDQSSPSSVDHATILA